MGHHLCPRRVGHVRSFPPPFCSLQPNAFGRLIRVYGSSGVCGALVADTEPLSTASITVGDGWLMSPHLFIGPATLSDPLARKRRIREGLGDTPRHPMGTALFRTMFFMVPSFFPFVWAYPPLVSNPPLPPRGTASFCQGFNQDGVVLISIRSLTGVLELAGQVSIKRDSSCGGFETKVNLRGGGHREQVITMMLILNSSPDLNDH